jgi:hypothetical protein
MSQIPSPVEFFKLLLCLCAAYVWWKGFLCCLYDASLFAIRMIEKWDRWDSERKDRSD